MPATREPTVSVRIIGRCNFRCPACSTASSPERKGRLSLAAFRRILGVLAASGFRGKLHLSGGEPTLHADLARMTAAASGTLGEGRIVVFTNGDWIGSEGWRARLESLLAGPNVLVRFSLDRQHAEGKARALRGEAWRSALGDSERALFDKAGKFLAACLEAGARPGSAFDFAFKGTLPEAREYLSRLGEVPVYPIVFQRDPANRAERPGFMAVDFDRSGRPRVFPSLRHVQRGEALGGLEALHPALEMSRRALNATG